MPNSVEKDIKNARKAKAIEIRAPSFFAMSEAVITFYAVGPSFV